MVFPATACLIQDRLGLRQTWGFDLSAACSGFLYALTTGAQLVASGAHRRVVVVGADLMSAIIDPLDRTTAVLFGDGAGAVLLEPAEPGFGLLDFHHRVDGSGAERPDHARRRQPPAGERTRRSTGREHYLKQNGRVVFKFAVSQMAEQHQRPAPAEPAHARRHRDGDPPPGQSAHPRRHGRAARAAAGADGVGDRALRQHDGGHAAAGAG